MTSNVCSECALRLFNTKHYKLDGIGNPYSGRCIIVSNVDYAAYKKGDMGFSSQVEIIKSIISSTGELDNLYILPFIRCNERISCDVTSDIVCRCMSLFAKDMRKYDFKDIMLLGESVKRFLNCEITPYLDTIIYSSKNKRKYFVNYSPLIKYIDDSKFEVFKNHLEKWYSSSINQSYEYSLISL